MKRITKILSGLLSAALFANLTAPALSEYLVSADDSIASMSEVVKEGLARYAAEIDISKYGLVYNLDNPGDAQSVASYARVEETLSYVLSDPTLFYVDTDSFKVGLKKDPNSNQYILSKLKMVYNNTYEDVAPLIEEFNTKVDAVIDEVITSDMTELQKVLKLHDYLVLNTVYDTAGDIPDLNGGSSAYDVLVAGNGVCQGYAQAFNILLDKIGMSSIMVTSDSMNHAWNLINVDGEWYHVDATWDDPIPDSTGRVNHKYFMLSDEAIQQKSEDRGYTHQDWDSKGFKATSTKYDNMFWSGVKTEMFVQDGNWYFVDKSGNYCTYNEASGEVSTVSNIDAELKWKVWGDESRYYLDKYSSMIVSDGIVYYNTPDQIYQMHFDGSYRQPLKYINPYETNGYVYGMVLKDDILYAVIKQDPDEKGTLYKVTELHLEKYSFIDTLVQTITDLPDGSSKTIEMPEDTEKVLPAAAIEAMKGRNIKLSIDLGDYTWNFSGKKVTAEEAKDLNLEIKQDQGIIPEEMIQSISTKNSTCVELNLTHSGRFGLTAGINYSLGIENADKVAVLYYYNQAEAQMDELDFMMVDRFGNIDIELEHASSYALILRDINAPDEPIISPAEKPPEETPVTTVTTIAPPEEIVSSEESAVTTEATIESTVLQAEDIVEVLGDITRDNVVDLLDLSVLSMACIHEVTLDSYQTKAADVTKDGEVDLRDLATMKQYIMNKITSFK